MFLKSLLTFLTDDAGRSFRKKDGIVETVATPTALSVGPDGLDDVSIRYGRSLEYWGMFRSFSAPLKFPLDGASIIRDQLLRKGTEARIRLVLHLLDKSFGGGWKHRLFYKGELDLSETESSEHYVTANIMEGDLVKLFRANEGTAYEIPIDVPEAKIIKHDGIILQAVTTFSITKSLAAQSLGQKQIIPMVFTSTQGNQFNYTFVNDYGDMIDGAANQVTTENFATSGKYLFKVAKARRAQIRIKGSIVGTGGNAGNSWHIETSRGQHILLGTFGFTLPQPALPTFDFTSTINLGEGEAVFVYRMSTAFNTTGTWNYGDDTKIEITTDDRADRTFIKALPLNYVFQQLLFNITGSSLYIFQSDYLTSEWSNLVITGMDAVRGLANPKLKISFSDLFQSVNVPCNISLSIKGNVVSIGRKSAAFGTTVVKNLGEVKDLRLRTYKEQQFSSVRIGWPDLKSEDVNGRDEFNVTSVFTSDITRVNKELTLVSKVYASMYEIEHARIRGLQDATANTETDADSCFLHVNKRPANPIEEGESVIFTYYNLLRKNYDSVTGILDPTSAYNIELSPMRCLLRHGNVLRSVFFWREASYLKFISSEKNSALKTILGSEVIQESADVLIGSLESPLFVPLTFQFDCAISQDIIATMEESPEGKFAFHWNNWPFYGHVIDIGIKPAGNPEQQVTLYCSPENNLLKLIA